MKKEEEEEEAEEAEIGFLKQSSKMCWKFEFYLFY